MKALGTEYCLAWNRDATNESDFSALPAGGRSGDIGMFVAKGSLGSRYSSESESNESAWQELYLIREDRWIETLLPY